MKKLIAIILTFSLVQSAFSQDITGDWNGLLEIQGIQLRLVFHIDQGPEGYSATMDSPDQGAKGIPVSDVIFEHKQITLKVAAAGIVYEGRVEDDGNISGIFKQMNYELPLILSKEAIAKPLVNRPQEPKAPFPYLVEEVTFENKADSVVLAGSLTLPKEGEQFPVAILISGSGPQDRNENLMNHKPFLVLADHLTRQGIAVLRYDDRGFGASTGDHASATSLDFARDVEAAVTFLKTHDKIDAQRIGLIGHSEGGLIAPIVASRSKELAFIVLLAGPGVNGATILEQQVAAIGKANGMTPEMLAREVKITKGMTNLLNQFYGKEDCVPKLETYLQEELKDAGPTVQGMKKEQFINMSISQMNRPWYANFIKHEPAKYLKAVECPVLALNGEKDVQVIPENLEAIEQALKKSPSKNYKILELEGMNHLFQECETGSVAEYGKIEQTFSPIALREISNWILQLW